MTTDELLKLVPFYVAGSLDTDENNLIEQQLSHSVELREEIDFWRRARKATISYAEYLNQGHPTSEELVDYIERSLQGLRSRLIDLHLTQCDNCRQEFEMISKTFPQAADSQRRQAMITGNRLFDLLSGLLKPAFAVPALAIIVLLFVLFFPQVEKENTLTIILSYQQAVRGGEQPTIQQFVLSQAASSIHLTLVIPHSEIPAVNYIIKIEPPNLEMRQIAEIASIKKGQQFDSLKTNIGLYYFPVDGQYRITVNENIADSADGLTPEVYDFIFIVVKD